VRTHPSVIEACWAVLGRSHRLPDLLCNAYGSHVWSLHMHNLQDTQPKPCLALSQPCLATQWPTDRVSGVRLVLDACFPARSLCAMSDDPAKTFIHSSFAELRRVVSQAGGGHRRLPCCIRAISCTVQPPMVCCFHEKCAFASGGRLLS
jgi:hypothetical protein